MLSDISHIRICRNKNKISKRRMKQCVTIKRPTASVMIQPSL